MRERNEREIDGKLNRGRKRWRTLWVVLAKKELAHLENMLIKFDGSRLTSSYAMSD